MCVNVCVAVSWLTTKSAASTLITSKPSLSDLLVSNVAVKEECTVSPSCMDYVSREHEFTCNVYAGSSELLCKSDIGVPVISALQHVY